MLLGINTATPYLSLALVDAEGALLGELGRDVGSEHSEAVFVMLETLFAWVGRERSELAAIGVTVGPGGFTGVRTGMALAKTVAQVLGIPVYGVETLQALAMQFPGPERVCPMLDARRGLVFAGLYDAAGTALVEPALHDAADWLASMAERPGALWVGEGATKHRAAIEAAGHAVPPDAAMAASAVPVALLAGRRLRAGEPSDGAALAPRYLREPQAVVNWEAAQAAKQAT